MWYLTHCFALQGVKHTDYPRGGWRATVAAAALKKDVEMKKLIMMLATAFAAAMPLMAETETVGGYTWTYRINGDTAC